MNATVFLEARFYRTPDRAVWATGTFSYHFWQRYLGVFSEIVVAARVLDVTEVGGDWIRSDGDKVVFAPIPHYIGPSQYLKNARKIRASLFDAAKNSEALIFRVPSPLANVVTPTLQKCGRPYGVEVVGDPFDTFAPGAVRHPLRRFLRWNMSRHLRRQCAHACAAAYVTKEILQYRYPAGSGVFTTHYSSIDLQPAAFREATDLRHRKDPPYLLVTVGSLEQLYKAPDVLIEAVALCRRQELDVRLRWIGDGKYRNELIESVRRLGLGDEIQFPGSVASAQAVRHHLQEADLFVLPSRTEGLPRAMIEAMAQSLTCVGTNIGGIPELLEPEDMVPVDDAGALAAKISSLLKDPEAMDRKARRNRLTAEEYRADVLSQRRNDFYFSVKHQTECWNQGRRS